MTRENNSVSNETWKEASKDYNILAYVPVSPFPTETVEIESDAGEGNSITRGDFHSVLAAVSRRTSEPESETKRT
jgi:hypothetical protein